MSDPAQVFVSATADSTSQPERSQTALDPAHAPLDARTPAEVAALARSLAGGLAFWKADGSTVLADVWPRFLPDLAAMTQEEAERLAGQAPQQALFLAFLRLYRRSQDSINRLTARHLDFHLREVLGLAPRGPRPDRVNLVLELKKTTRALHVPAGTAFTTKDGLAYHTEFEIFANRAALVHRRILARDAVDAPLRYAAEAASLDGLGEPLPEEKPTWHPFGRGHPLPAAPRGFALSAPVLALREGERTITIHLELRLAGGTIEGADLLASARAQLSGEDAWLDAGLPTACTATPDGSGAWTLDLVYTLASGAGAVVPFDPTVLEGGFDTLAPVLKVVFGGERADAAADALAVASVEGVSLEVAVTGMKDLVLEHDNGRVDPSKAFLPFGPAPRAGSSLYINAEEALNKDVTSASLHLAWSGAPANLAQHYSGYTTREGATAVTSNAQFTASLEVLRDGRFEALLPDTRLFEGDATTVRTIDSTKQEQPLLALGRLPFATFTAQIARTVRSARVQLPFARVAVSSPLSTLRPSPALRFKENFRLPGRLVPGRLLPKTQRGFLRLRLKQDFLHDRFPELFADAIAFNQTDAGKARPRPVPRPAYTPELASLTLDYRARSGTARPGSEDAGDFETRPVRLFHLTAFGQREEHTHLKAAVGAETRTATLVPAVENPGELYLGLSGIGPRETVSLLFQVEEGTANPLASAQVVTWSVLCSNHWRTLASDEILADGTRGLLQSGVVRLLLPAATSSHNTLLDPGLVWLRAAVHEDTSAVCRVVALHTNAVPATLADPAAATHLAAALPAGSVKLAPAGLRGLKSTAQPYASTDGAGPEDVPAFRLRASERLRHRGRAVTAWDIEHLVLDAFPRVYRARVLPHTDRTLTSRPGAITVVVIPDVRGAQVDTTPDPMTDLATLAAIEAFLAGLHTPFATIAAINPRYEPLQLAFAVKFAAGLPFASYRPILDADLRRHLAPWSAADSRLPGFGGGVHRSALVSFIESLPYVDYLRDLVLRPVVSTAGPGAIQEVRPSTAASILTSATSHQIDPID